MYTLYCYPGSRATAAHMVLAEGALDYQIRHVDFVHDEHRTPEYLAINPRATIPALVVDDGTVICETIAIMLYLSDKHALALAPSVTDSMRGVPDDGITFAQMLALAPSVTDSMRGPLLDWLVYHAVEVQEPHEAQASLPTVTPTIPPMNRSSATAPMPCSINAGGS